MSTFSGIVYQLGYNQCIHNIRDIPAKTKKPTKNREIITEYIMANPSNGSLGIFKEPSLFIRSLCRLTKDMLLSCVDIFADNQPNVINLFYYFRISFYVDYDISLHV